MEHSLFGIPDLDKYAVLAILALFGGLEAWFGYLRNSRRTRSDWIQEAGTFLLLSVLIKPGIVLAVGAAGERWLPDWSRAWGSWPFWLMLPLYLLVDDLLQYWYHRSAHEHAWLWKLHRAHHQAEEMGFFVSYRNAVMYYVLMPNIWWIGIVVLLGGAKAVAAGLILKQLVIVSSHSRVAWDEPLYRRQWSSPLMAVVERIIVTPAFHHAHHGKSIRDGIGAPESNFGNMFSIWDQLFGSAVFTRRFPTEYGLPHDPKEHWAACSLYPLVSAADPSSELSRGFHKQKTTTGAPCSVELPAGVHLWCRCGCSRTQPFCDGSHHGTGYKPVRIELDRARSVQLCCCGLTDHPPWCDQSHRQLSESTNETDTAGD